MNVFQSVPVRRPVTPADEVAMVRVCTPFEVSQLKPPVAPAVTIVCVELVEPFREVIPAELPQSKPVDCKTPLTSRIQFVPDKLERVS